MTNDAVYIYQVGLGQMIDAVQNVGAHPSFKTVTKLEATLHAQFLDTQARTHVITGSLKMSGKVASDFHADGNWEGSITYGGAAAGAVNDPVDYAVYEMARGGDHDFFGGLVDYQHGYVEAIQEHFAEG